MATTPVAPAAAPSHALTIDVEDYFQVGVFQDRLPVDEWSQMTPRVERNVDRILTLLDQRGVKATFFVLGWIAERHPGCIERIAKAGHEVGSHGYGHRPVWNLTPEEFEADIERSQDVIGTAIGQIPTTYRAPCFSVTPKTTWALDIIHAHGIRYDSSIFPVRHPEYGMPGAEDRIHRVQLKNGGELLEFPMSTARFLGRKWAVCGGGYFRLLPYAVTRRALKRLSAADQPFVFYLHPWEIDPDQPRLDDRATRLGRFRHYLNLSRTERRFVRLLDEFRFGTMRDVFAWAASRDDLPVVTY